MLRITHFMHTCNKLHMYFYVHQYEHAKSRVCLHVSACASRVIPFLEGSILFFCGI